MRANALKSALILLSSLGALAFFADHGTIAWEAGPVIAGGSVAVGCLGAAIAAEPAAKRWTVRLLLAVILIEGAALLRR